MNGARRFRAVVAVVPAVLVVTALAVTDAAGAVAAPVEARLTSVAAEAVTATFDTPGEHAWTVPAGVSRVDVVAVGGEGGGTTAVGGGRAGRTAGTLDVTPGEVLYAVVGSSASGSTPGSNGGGAAGGTPAGCVRPAGAGGGASDVRTVATGQPGSAASRVLVAGGGGGQGALGGDPDIVVPTDAGHRGQGGVSTALGGYGGADGVGGLGGDSGAAGQGTATTGGAGGASGTTSARCGGGGGGGWGGGGGGAAGESGAPSGGGGGGGSLAPAGFSSGLALRGTVASVTFVAPGRPAPAGPLQVTSAPTFRQADLGSGSCPFCNCPTSCRWTDSGPGTAPGVRRVDDGYANTQSWASISAREPDFSQSFASVRGAAGDPAALDAPFLLTRFTHYNNEVRGDSPSVFGLQIRTVVQPPAGPPVALTMAGPTTVQLNFVETDNDPPCDPSIQVSSIPCDDRWSFNAVGQSVTTTASGLTWRLAILGWRTAEGTFVRDLVTLEGDGTPAEIWAQVSVTPRSTTSTLAVDESDPDQPELRLTTTPVPQTGGRVTFSSDGVAIPGCVDLPVGATTGVTTCTPPAPVTGLHTYTGSFHDGVGYGSSTSDPVDYEGPAGVPGAPSAVSAVRGDQQATISWAAAAGNGAPVSGYTVTASPGGKTCVTTGALSCTVTGLVNGTAYRFSVVATNSVGASAPSGLSNEVSPAGVPGAPSAVSAVRGDQQATISWAAAAGNGAPVSGYTVTASPGGKTCVTTGALSCTVTGLVNGTAYRFSVVATNSVGAGPRSAASAAVKPAGRPKRVLHATVTAQGRSATVRWRAASANGAPILRYVVDRIGGPDIATEPTTRSATFRNLKPGVYRFRVIAYNAVGASRASATIKVRIR